MIRARPPSIATCLRHLLRDGREMKLPVLREEVERMRGGPVLDSAVSARGRVMKWRSRRLPGTKQTYLYRMP